MHNYKEIIRMARKKGIKLTESTLRDNFCRLKIKPEKFILRIAYFNDEDIDSYWALKEASLARVGRPKVAKDN